MEVNSSSQLPRLLGLIISIGKAFVFLTVSSEFTTDVCIDLSSFTLVVYSEEQRQDTMSFMKLKG